MTKVFYSWQKDLPNSTNQGFIEKALEGATKSIRNDDSVQVEPVVDRDTEGVTGSPDISSTIFSKIDVTDVFVGDISIINTGAQVGDKPVKPTPNPNVLVELGYAAKVLGWEKVIMVLNSSTGPIGDLPFDLRQRRAIEYFCAESDSDKESKRNDLKRKLEQRLREILINLDIFLPEISLEDNLIFKKLCAKSLEVDSPLLGRRDIFGLTGEPTLGESADSLEILHRKGYISGTWMADGEIEFLFIEQKGFSLYTRAFVKSYKELIRNVRFQILQDSKLDSSEIANVLGQKHLLVKQILYDLADQKLIEIIGDFRGFMEIIAISPELKRKI